MAYIPQKQAHKLTIPIRSLEHRVYQWGNPDADPLFLIHGWADTGASFQFTTDFLSDDWCVIAPDLRGFGESDWNQQGYWFPDYLADLDVLFDHLAPDKEIKLVGHSMGGNIAALYAGVRPERISHLVSLDQYGLKETPPEDAPMRYAKWLRQWQSPHIHSKYDDINATVDKLLKLAPYMSKEHAQYLAPYWTHQNDEGVYESRIDPAHKRVNPVLYRREEARACWKRITAKVLLVLGEESRFNKRFDETGMLDDFRECFDELSEVVVSRSDHMIHLDQPEELASILDGFFLEE